MLLYRIRPFFWSLHTPVWCNQATILAGVWLSFCAGARQDQQIRNHGFRSIDPAQEQKDGQALVERIGPASPKQPLVLSKRYYGWLVIYFKHFLATFLPGSTWVLKAKNLKYRRFFFVFFKTFLQKNPKTSVRDDLRGHHVLLDHCASQHAGKLEFESRGDISLPSAAY